MTLLSKVVNSFRFAGKGLYVTWRTQRNMKIHTVCAIAVCMLSYWLRICAYEWLIVVICITSVIAAELLNTAIEHIVDLVSPQWHELAGKAKDASAAFVLITAFGAAVCGCAIFLPKLIPYLPF